jgi:3-oxoacyl-[acyl-carrier protein] reductase
VLSAHGAALALAARQTAKLKTLEAEIKAGGGRAVAILLLASTASRDMTGSVIAVDGGFLLT